MIRKESVSEDLPPSPVCYALPYPNGNELSTPFFHKPSLNKYTLHTDYIHTTPLAFTLKHTNKVPLFSSPLFSSLSASYIYYFTY